MKNKVCEVNYSFKNGFLLGEEQLQTVTSIIRERYPGTVLFYRVTKSDSYIYQTTDLQEILGDENGNANYIRKLEVVIDDDAIKFVLCFEKYEDTLLRIEGDDKDKIYLLYSELKRYVEKEITTVKMFFEKKRMVMISMIITSIPLLGMMCFLLTILRRIDSTEMAKKAIASPDITVKLDYLIEAKMNNELFVENRLSLVVYMMIATFLLMIGLPLLNVALKKSSVLRITDFFLFGRQKEIYEKKMKFKNNIIWGIVIALIVGIFASAVVALFIK